MTRDIYESKEPTALRVGTSSQMSFLESLKAHGAKGAIFGGSWFLLMGIWFNWSLTHDQYLLWESLPAFAIVTLLLIVRAIDRNV